MPVQLVLLPPPNAVPVEIPQTLEVALETKKAEPKTVPSRNDMAFYQEIRSRNWGVLDASGEQLVWACSEKYSRKIFETEPVAAKLVQGMSIWEHVPISFYTVETR